MKMENAGIIGLIVGAAGLLWAGYVGVKCSKIADKVGMSLDDISSSSDIQIKDSMVKQAVQVAVDRAAKDVVEKASRRAIDSVSSSMASQIHDAVEEAYGDVKEGVKTRLESQVDSVNIDRVRREIVNAGRDKAAKVFGEALDDIRDQAKDKFESELNSMLSRHNDELNSVNRIYSSIAESMSGSSRGTVLKLS